MVLVERNKVFIWEETVNTLQRHYRLWVWGSTQLR